MFDTYTEWILSREENGRNQRKDIIHFPKVSIGYRINARDWTNIEEANGLYNYWSGLVMLVNSTIANEFLASYKAVLTEVNGGKIPQDIDKFAECRKLLYSNPVSIAEHTNITEDFKDALSKSIYGRFIFLKKYKSWYAFQNIATGRYFAALGLTSPIEAMVEDFSVVETALVPYRGLIVCDGLIVNNNILLGKNMIKNCRKGYFRAKRSGDLIQVL